MNGEILFFIIPAIVIAVIVFKLFFSQKAIIKRKLKKAGSKSITNFKNGEIAKVTGRVEIVGKQLIAPLSKRVCSHYYVLVEERVSSGKSSHWDKIIEEEVTSNFLIKDGESYAFINDDNLKSYIVQDKEYSSGFMNDATRLLESYLNSKGYKSENRLGFNKAIRYKEGILEDYEKVAVFGKGEWKDAATLGFPDKYKRILEITSHDAEAVYLSDDPETTLRNEVKTAVEKCKVEKTAPATKKKAKRKPRKGYNRSEKKYRK